MPVTTRGQDEFEQYLQSDEVKENKQKIHAAVDANHTLDVFNMEIRQSWAKTGKKRCLLYMPTGEPEVLRFGVFYNPQHVETMFEIYNQTLRDALNKRIVFVRGN